MLSRAPAVVLLAAFLTAVVCSNPALNGQDPMGKKDKEPPREPTKLPELKWPLEISGKNLKGWLDDLTNPDPAIREAALRTLPNFGPVVQKAAGKILLGRMQSEKDPGVRLQVFRTVATIGFEEKDKKDEIEAVRLLGNIIDTAPPGGMTRLQAVQAIAAFGPRAYTAVHFVAGNAAKDTCYETRRTIANTLAMIGFSDTFGPNNQALRTLAGVLAHDISAAVRMEALQSLVLLGPPWAAVRPAGGNVPPQIDQSRADYVAEQMRARLGMGKLKGAGKETDAQLEIWCRVVLMRFDPKEIGPAHLGAIAKHLDPNPRAEAGPKLQALQALAIFGEKSKDQVDAVVKIVNDDDPRVVATAMATLASMGVEAQGAIPELKKMVQKWQKLRDDKKQENLKNKDFRELYLKMEQKARDQLDASMLEEQTRMGITKTIEWLTASKPGKPGGDLADPPKPKKDEPPKK